MPCRPPSPLLHSVSRRVQLRLIAGNWQVRALFRIETTPALAAHKETLLSDWPAAGEHWRWLATAHVDELVDWAIFVEGEPTRPVV